MKPTKLTLAIHAVLSLAAVWGVFYLNHEILPDGWCKWDSGVWWKHPMEITQAIGFGANIAAIAGHIDSLLDR